MDKSLFRYIWTHSKRDQLLVCGVVLASQPFYFMSLDLPRQIVNEAIQGQAFKDGQMTAPFLRMVYQLPSWLGGATLNIFEGFQVGRIGLLVGLSCLFLVFVLINGAFKYWINVAKGALGERMLRRMRFSLFSMVLRFTPEALRTVKSSETATIIKDEVEPIGGFIGDAFITPVFLGFQAITALVFIMVQNVWLGLMAVAMIAVQFTVIPRLRRELLKLGRQRQLASRELAGRIAEVLDGIEVVHVHNAQRWEQAEIGHRLFGLFDIRLKIYNRKFMVKFLNNLLAQMTPFLFYVVGGFFALRGTLDIGQLVAVINAYRELPPPLKELIDWDQQRLDVQVKYDQVVQHFAPERLIPLNEMERAVEDAPLTGPLTAEGINVADPHGGTIIDNASFSATLPARIGLISDGTAAASSLARIIAGRLPSFTGQIRIGERDLTRLPVGIIGRRMAYAGTDPTLFPGSIRDNLVYGLRAAPAGSDADADREEERRISEAKRTGNPVESIGNDWIDYRSVGASDARELDGIFIGLLDRIGLSNDLYRFGLAGRPDLESEPELAERLIEARRRLFEAFQADGMKDLVEHFDARRYNNQATIAENLLFGVPVADDFVGRNLSENKYFRSALDRAGLVEELTDMGLQIAETMTEIFEGIPPGHPLFQQFSFIGADELDDFEAILRRNASGGRTHEDGIRLLSLPLAYIETRHRLGLLDDNFKVRLVRARGIVRQTLEALNGPTVEFYDPDRICPPAPLRDNLLFGRISYNVANAQNRVAEAVSNVLRDLGLVEDVQRIGLGYQVGTAGRLLDTQQRASINLVRCLVKKPDILIVDGALAPFDETRVQALIGLLIEMVEDRSLFMVLSNETQAKGFDIRMRFRRGQVTTEESERSSDKAKAPADDAELAGEVA
ncbi:ABC transporter transmembrane domain-containing protein [Microvirga pudoricolor]|uniref:ABC transporter transmembrane domain-containing protein n=1 Tax=Microvirga pudoricolor TaxID=2778729 RepID=UPI0019523489|nr:ABC transporter ATP-binding protein [Microvirga pudoricolor]MBM6592557.1 ABC transporter ATP-binding protein [Microvirga pudoricolor]